MKILVIIILIISSCKSVNVPAVDDTEHTWIGGDGVKFKE